MTDRGESMYPFSKPPIAHASDGGDLPFLPESAFLRAFQVIFSHDLCISVHH